MPLFFLKEINTTTKLAIWKIEEMEDFFILHVPLSNSITHPHKRLQHLAGRYLLKLLYPDFPMHAIEIAETRKPFIRNEQYHFSISHSGNFAAAIVSSSFRIGIDIEMKSEKIAKIASKFLHPIEIELHQLQNIIERINQLNLNKLALLWSAKEAIYKWWGKGAIDFKEMIKIHPFTLEREGTIKAVFKGVSPTIPLEVDYNLFNNLCCVWVLEKI